MRWEWRQYWWWVLLFAVLWWLLAGFNGWLFAITAALGGAAVAMRLALPLPQLHWRRLPRFLGFFAVQLVLGGWDVARRALHPRLPLAPGWVSYRFTSTNPRVHMLLSAIVGLLPGTLASHYDHQQMAVHALDQHSDWHPTIARLESLLDRLLIAPAAA